MTDRELLENAAKAAGIFDLRFDSKGIAYRNVHVEWNPLTDDGDALRLAVRLSIYIQPFTEAQTPCVFTRSVNKIGTEQVLPLGDDPCAATRRAIVRAAAEIGRNT